MLSGDTRGEQQVTSDITLELHFEQQDVSTSEKRRKKVTITHPQEVNPTIGSKRSISEASGSLRASKVAKVNNAKQSQRQTTTIGRKVPPILSESPMINMMARKRAQSHANLHARSPSSHARSPSSHARSPISTGTLKSPSLLDLSPALTHSTPTSMNDLLPAAATQGSKRRPRKLTSAIWKDAEPIYIGGLLMEGKCKYCSNIFPASKVSGTTTLGRHLKVCEMKNSMDGVIEQIRTSCDKVDPNWKFDQEAARIELVKLVILHGLPFSFVEYAGFRKFCKSLNLWFKKVNRVTIQNDCMAAYH